jgi:sigma-B regulation protein RsbU (phosphoserine phosphatase)
MKIKDRILIQTLSASLVFTLVLSALFFISVAGIRNTVLANSGNLGNSAAVISAAALKEQLGDNITRIARDMALILDEKLIKVENHTRMTADIAGAIYTRAEAYSPKPLRYVQGGEISASEPYLHTAPGVSFSQIRAEAALAGNIAEVLRQITVIDRGITTSTIAGESGYIIAMDAYPWPQAEFDPRRYSWYRGAKESGALFWTGVYADLRGRGPVISCAMPFYAGSEGDAGSGRVFKGVARSTVMLADFSRIIDSAGVGRTGYFFLLDNRGVKLFSGGGVDVFSGDNGSIEGENFLSGDPALRSLGLSMTLGASGMTSLEMNGVPVYAAYAPIASLGWSLGLAIPASEISAPALSIGEEIRRITNEAKTGMDRRILYMAGFMAAALAATLFAIAVFSVRFTAAITRPILALNEGVREVSGGNLEREVRVTSGDELEQLALSFNAMTGRLREHIARIALATAEQQRISTELDVAKRIQMSILPGDFPPFQGRKNEFDLLARIHPAREVGGDFYDFFFIDDDHFVFLVADVSGKGVPAALFMAVTKTLIKSHLQSAGEIDLALEQINRQLCGNNITDMFVTLWLGELELSSRRLSYVNAGHNPPLLAREGGGFGFLKSVPDLVLAGMEDTVYRKKEIILNPGDTLFLYTDGITEAENTLGEFYGKERLHDFLDSHHSLSLAELLPALSAGLETFSSGAEQSDDITMLALRLCPAKRDKVSLRLRADAAELEKLLDFIGSKLEAAACPEKIRGQIELAAEELFVNIARYSGAEELDLSWELEINGGSVSAGLCFSDRGAPFNPLEKPDPDITLPLEEREAGGLGILIVKRTMDSIEYTYENGMNRLLIKKSW